MDKKLHLISYGLMVLGFAVSGAAQFVGNKMQDQVIAAKVAEEVAKNLGK